ncbi:hypothetical protein AURDEDRAFT_168392 [Auricularia subglabra TFB-10046 SS5]|nr:hypothetical protein AURDEDRAFT_168392 [Auricularia subglabra TFB-10046 SS5]
MVKTQTDSTLASTPNMSMHSYASVAIDARHNPTGSRKRRELADDDGDVVPAPGVAKRRRTTTTTRKSSKTHTTPALATLFDNTDTDGGYAGDVEPPRPAARAATKRRAARAMPTSVPHTPLTADGFGFDVKATPLNFDTPTPHTPFDTRTANPTLESPSFATPLELDAHPEVYMMQDDNVDPLLAPVYLQALVGEGEDRTHYVPFREKLGFIEAWQRGVAAGPPPGWEDLPAPLDIPAQYAFYRAPVTPDEYAGAGDLHAGDWVFQQSQPEYDAEVGHAGETDPGWEELPAPLDIPAQHAFYRAPVNPDQYAGAGDLHADDWVFQRARYAAPYSPPPVSPHDPLYGMPAKLPMTLHEAEAWMAAQPHDAWDWSILAELGEDGAYLLEQYRHKVKFEVKTEEQDVHVKAEERDVDVKAEQQDVGIPVPPAAFPCARVENGLLTPEPESARQGVVKDEVDPDLLTELLLDALEMQRAVA